MKLSPLTTALAAADRLAHYTGMSPAVAFRQVVTARLAESHVEPIAADLGIGTMDLLIALAEARAAAGAVRMVRIVCRNAVTAAGDRS